MTFDDADMKDADSLFFPMLAGERRLIDDGAYYIELTSGFVPEQAGAVLFMRDAVRREDACLGDIVRNSRGQWLMRLYPDFDDMEIDMQAYIARSRGRVAPGRDMTVALVELWKMRTCFRPVTMDQAAG